MDSYLLEKFLWYKADARQKEYIVAGGINQSSVLWPLLWEVMYDGVIGLGAKRGNVDYKRTGDKRQNLSSLQAVEVDLGEPKEQITKKTKLSKSKWLIMKPFQN